MTKSASAQLPVERFILPPHARGASCEQFRHRYGDTKKGTGSSGTALSVDEQPTLPRMLLRSSRSGPARSMNEDQTMGIHKQALRPIVTTRSILRYYS